MLPCPLQNTAKFKMITWVQQRPYITQKFGERPEVYKQFGLDGHNGIDYRCKVGTPVFAPIEGKVRVKKDQGGYGYHVKIRNKYGKEVVLAHLSEFYVKDGEHVFELQKIAASGNTGFSSGPHLHFGFRRLKIGKGNIYTWSVDNYDNGYLGYIDQINFVYTWKGGHLKNNF